MTVLAVESSGKTVSVALSSGNRYGEILIDAGFRHSETLMPGVEYLLLNAGITPDKIDLVACSAGPGSFTGLRIGMATVKGIAHGAGCAFKTVPTIPLFAVGREHWPGIVAPIMDARKNRIYAGAFQNGIQIIDDCDIALDDFFDLLPLDTTILVTGPDAHLAKKRDNIVVDPLYQSGRCRAMIDFASREFENNGGDSLECGPIYIRLSEAEDTLKKIS